MGESKLLDKTSKQVMNFLRFCPDHTHFYADELPDDLPPLEEFFAAVRYLARKDFAEIVCDQRGRHVGVRLTHEGIHYREFAGINALRYVLDNWISFVSLLVALAALVISCLRVN